MNVAYVVEVQSTRELVRSYVRTCSVLCTGSQRGRLLAFLFGNFHCWPAMPSLRSGSSLPPTSPTPSNRSRRTNTAGKARRGSKDSGSQQQSAAQLSSSQAFSFSGHSSSTDEDERSEAELLLSPSSTASSTSKRGPRSKNKVRTNARGLEITIQKEILTDLEDSKGLAHVLSQGAHAITAFCDLQAGIGEEGEPGDREDIYGAPRSKQRLKVNNKIRGWARLSQAEYEQILIGQGIIPYNFRQGKAGPPSVVSVPVSKHKPRRKSKTPRAAAAEATPDSVPSGGTPKSSNVNAFGNRSFQTYREPPPVLDSSDDEANTQTVSSLGTRSNATMSQASEGIPVGTCCFIFSFFFWL